MSIKVYSEKVPYLKEAIEMASMGIIPAGSYNNQEFLKDKVEKKRELSFEEEMILYDAQTSGGLLISVEEKKAFELVEKIKNEGIDAAVIAEVCKGEKPLIIV